MWVGKTTSSGNFNEQRNMISLPRNKLFSSPRSLCHYSKLLKSNVLAAAPAFDNRYNLPRLPVPKLSQTLEKYFKTVQPFLSNNELDSTRAIIEGFQRENGIGDKLQKLLVEKAQQSDNWLANWWLQVAYLTYRNPVVVHSSPGQVFPMEDFKNEADRLTYTAKLILAALDYKSLIESDQMPLDKMGKDPLDMNQYKKIFGTCRIPGKKIDSLQFNTESKHIIIACNNNFFKLGITDHSGGVLSMNELISILEEILEKSEHFGASIGVLTADNRDNWGEAYQHLISDPINARSVGEIQQSLFLVCLDNPMPKWGGDSRTVASHQLIHGGGSRGNSANRWFDKTVQFVIGKDGIVGLTYEHSPSEGQPIAVMTDYLVDYINSNSAENVPDRRFVYELQKLPFRVDTKLENYIHRANQNIDKLMSNLEIDSFQFNQFGKEFVKSQKFSPDSFIQIAMQLAFYRIHNVPGAHYESAATRKYIHGRTETIRSCSNQSVNFAKAMLDPTKSNDERLVALKGAISVHKQYSIEAVNGFGVDRHLLGLKLTAQENGLDVPELFTDVAYSRSMHWRISTSQVATKCDGFMVYGPAVDDGYACCYNPRANDINFGVSVFESNRETSATQFKHALELSLREMHDLLAHSQKSKL